MDAACRREIEELHRFFQDWFLGKLARSDEAFARFAGVVADDFQIISPGGALTARQSLLEGLFSAHATRTGAFRIWTEQFRSRSVGDGLALATYEEWQDLHGESRGRLSTALFRRRQGTPHGIEWVHVHECWLPDATGGV